MHIDIIDDLNFIIFLNNMQTDIIDFNKKDELEKYLKKLFINLKRNYSIEVNGFYNISVYVDQNYGIILEIEKEEIDYLDYFEGQIDMSITVEKNNNFLYKIDDFLNINNKIKDRIKIYYYKNEFYVKITDKLSVMEMGNLLEYSKIIYHETDKIIKFSKQINSELFQ